MSKPHLSGITRGSVGFLGGRDLPSLHAALKQSDQKVDTTLASHLSPCLCSTYPPFPVRAGWLPNLRVWKETQSKKKWCLIVSLCLIVSVCMEIRREWEHISIKMHRSWCVLILYKNFGAGGKKGGKALFHILNLEQPWDLPLLVGIVLPIDGTIT